MPELQTGRVIPLTITRGETWTQTLRVGSGDYTYRAIAAAGQVAPCRLTVTGHGLPEGWFAWVSDAKGMPQLNCEPPRAPYRVHVVDADHVDLLNINASGWPAYAGKGVLYTRLPLDLTGLQGRMQVRAAPGADSPVLIDLNSGNGRLSINTTDGSITLSLLATDTAALAFDAAVYDLELFDGAGNVKKLIPTSPITIGAEVTQ